MPEPLVDPVARREAAYDTIFALALAGAFANRMIPDPVHAAGLAALHVVENDLDIHPRCRPKREEADRA